MSNYQFDRLKVAPAYKIVSDTLQQAIIDREFKPGDALPTEGALAEQFGVNRSTVREGIRALEQFGFVHRQGKKLVVVRPSQELVGDHLSKVLILHDVSFQDLWEVKMALEPLAAQLAATHATDDLVDRLFANIDAMRAAIEAGTGVIKLDIEFHALVAQAADNQALTVARGAIAQLFYPTYKASMLNKVASDRLLQAHENIAQAIKDRDVETAGNWMRKHIVDFKRGYVIAGLDVQDTVTF